MRIMVVSPHPDDDIIGVGGSIALHARAGHEVTTVHVVGRERAAGDDCRSDAELDEEIDRANALIGITDRVQLHAPSRGMAATREVRLGLVTAMRSVRPEMVYLPHADEVDEEHALVHRLAKDALWMAASTFFGEAPGEAIEGPSLVLGYEVWTPIRRPQFTQDIGETVELKAKAMSEYRSQLEHADWVSAVQGLAAYRGTTALGAGSAEVFTVEELAPRAIRDGFRFG